MAIKRKHSNDKLVEVKLTRAELEEALKTREYKLTEGKRDSMYISKKMIKSNAWFDLKTSAACQVYMIFLTKCKTEKVKALPMRPEQKWIIANNGVIQFTYREALKKWGIKDKRFIKAIDELIRVGLIDIIRTGSGLHKDVTLYAISERWKKFGTDKFVSKERPKRKTHYGFAKGNKLGRNTKSKQSQHSSVTVDQQLSATVDTESEVE